MIGNKKSTRFKKKLKTFFFKKMGNGQSAPPLLTGAEKPSVLFFNNNEITGQFSSNPNAYTFIGAGNFGCAFHGPFGNKKDCIIKFNRYRNKDKKLAQGYTTLAEAAEANYDTSVREATIGNFLNDAMLPSSALAHWGQTIALGYYIGPMPVFAMANGVAVECATDFTEARLVHYILVQERAGTMNLAEWMGDSRLDTDQITAIAFQCCWALYTANASLGFVHCDLKPENMAVQEYAKQKTITYVMKDVATFVLDIKVDDPQIRIIDYGLGFLEGGENGAPIASVFHCDLGGSPIFSPLEMYAAETNSDITAARDMFSLGVMLVCLKANKQLSFVAGGKKYNYGIDKQAPVSGRTSSGNGPVESVFAVDAFNFDKTAPTTKAKLKLCESIWGIHDDDTNAVHKERARDVAQTLLLQRALGVDLKNVNDKVKKFIVAFLPAEKTTYEKNVRKLFDNKVEKDKLLLDFIRRLLAVDPNDRLSFGLGPPMFDNDKHAWNNTLFHALFIDMIKPVRGDGDVFVFERGSRLPLLLNDDSGPILDKLKDLDASFRALIPAHVDPKDVVVSPAAVKGKEKKEMDIVEVDQDVIDKLTALFFDPNVETGFLQNAKKNANQQDLARSTKNEAFLIDAYAAVMKNVYKGGEVKGYTMRSGGPIRVWKTNVTTLTRVQDQKKKKRKPEDPSNRMTSTVAGVLLYLAIGKGNAVAAYIENAEKSVHGAYNDIIQPIFPANVNFEPYRTRALGEFKLRNAYNPVESQLLLLPEVCSILESIEHCNDYKSPEKDGFAFDLIAATLLPPIEDALNRHFETITSDTALSTALRPLLDGDGALVFPPSVPGQIRFFHWMSVAVDMLHTLDKGQKVDAFMFQRCQSEMPPAFMPQQKKGRVVDV